MTAFAGRLVAHIHRYVDLRRALGHAVDTQAATLCAFGRFVEQRAEAGPLTQQLVLAFVLTCPGTPRVRAKRYGVLRHFADYLAVFEPQTEALDPRALPPARSTPPIRLPTDDELTRLLRAARQISPRYPLRGQSRYTMIGRLASTGLRSGEVARLDRRDVDRDRGSLLIRRTKFRKNRLVPLHSTTRDALRVYAHARDRAFPASRSPAFFLSLRGSRWSACGFRQTFRAMCGHAGLDDGHARTLHPHALRHRFAVTRLVEWSRAHVDVQAGLPRLATSRGHARYSDTAYYITGTPDLWGRAASRAFGPDGGAS